MSQGKLYYADTATSTVIEHEYTRDRAMCVTPIFFKTRREALLVIEEDLERRIFVLEGKVKEIRKGLGTE